jgi:osmotically-inducible protein OsmY
MQAQRFNILRLGTLAGAVAVGLSLAACNKAEDVTVCQRVDGAVADAKLAATGATQTATQAADAMKTNVSDATITTKINAASAADDKLSAIKIDVDTSNGRVTLNGTTPESMVCERASTLALAVEGVSSVDNRLVVTSN